MRDSSIYIACCFLCVLMSGVMSDISYRGSSAALGIIAALALFLGIVNMFEGK